MEEDISNKKSIGLVSDEMGDLPEEIIKENEISIVPFKIEYGELENLPGNVYQKIRTAEQRGMKSLIKTSQPSINAFLSVYQEKLKHFENVICVSFSSKVSGSYNSALQAVKFLPANLQSKVAVIDSLLATGTEGLFILKLIDLIKNTQLKFSEIIQKITKEIPNYKLLATYDKPKWIEASGRLPSFLPMALNQAELRNIKPIFGLKGGKLSIVGIRKNINGLGQTIFEEFEKQTLSIKNSGRKIKIAITHADNPEQAEKLVSLVKARDYLELIFVNLVCFPVGGHVGPGTLILSWQQE